MNTEIKMKKMYKEPQTDILHEMEELMKVVGDGGSAGSPMDSLHPQTPAPTPKL